MKLLGLDIGDRRVGVSFGDTSLGMAIPTTVVTRSSLEQDGQAIAALVREYDVERVIAGLPRNTDGSLGPQAEATLVFVEALKRFVAIPIETWNEHLSTVEAGQRRLATGQRQGPGRGSRRKRLQPTIDAHAAAVILQDYMDDQANKTHEIFP